MKKEDIYGYIDHTELKAFATWKDIEKLCQEAVTYSMASVCIPSCYIKAAHEHFPTLNLCTVVGFPLGYANTEAKVAETKQAILDGASEIDMVINIGMAKSKLFDEITDEIKALKEACNDKILKVIIETCYLDKDEKIALCHCVTDAGADFIKTSTGFGTAGATLEDVILMKENIGENVKIKAAGGIRSLEDMLAYIDAGCSRIGTSSAIKILSGES